MKRLPTQDDMHRRARGETYFHFAYTGTIVRSRAGWTLRSLGDHLFVGDGEEGKVRLFHDATGEQMMLAEWLAGRRFTEFDPVEIFGTAKPAGATIAEWLRSLEGDPLFFPAMAWVKKTVPLDVLLGILPSSPARTIDPATGWHWSSEMQAAGNPSYYASQAEFRHRLRNPADTQASI
jgi:hypothetical protein